MEPQLKTTVVWYVIRGKACSIVKFRCIMCASLSKLETLELRENMLRYLPSSVCRLVKLQSLDLGDNVLEELVSVCTLACSGF